MKITKRQLRKIIKEELSKSVDPSHIDVLAARAAEVLRSLSESVLPGTSEHMTYEELGRLIATSMTYEELGRLIAASGLKVLSDSEMYYIQIEQDGITFSDPSSA